MKLLLIALCIALINAECPDLLDIPDMHSADTFMCARFYYGFGHDLPVRGCNGCSIQDYYDIPAGQDYNAPDGKQLPFGSILVKPGCQFYVFHDHNYGGGYDIYEGPAIISKVPGGHDTVEEGCANGHPSFQCRCGMKPVTCTPKDEWQVVLRCDATNAVETVNCNYIKKVGVVYSEEMSESMSVSTTISYKLTASLFDLFSETLGISVTTGFDWGFASTVTKSVTEQFEVLADAPAGLLLTIEQALGKCGDTEVWTEMFRIRHTNAKGEIVHEFLEKL